MFRNNMFRNSKNNYQESYYFRIIDPQHNFVPNLIFQREVGSVWKWEASIHGHGEAERHWVSVPGDPSSATAVSIYFFFFNHVRSYVFNIIDI